MDFSIIPVQRHCPNCGRIETAYPDKSGTVKMICHTCTTIFISKPKGRRHSQMDIFIPEGAILPEYIR